jgi:hypothetical protein
MGQTSVLTQLFDVLTSLFAAWMWSEYFNYLLIILHFFLSSPSIVLKLLTLFSTVFTTASGVRGLLEKTLK